MAMLSEELIATIAEKYAVLSGILDERQRRLWAGLEADLAGHGGLTAVARATGLARSTVVIGRREVRAGAKADDVVNVRRAGNGRPPVDVAQPALVPTLQSLIESSTRGDPESPLLWTCKSTRALAAELKGLGLIVGRQKVCELLHSMGYSLQAAQKTIEGRQHPDRNAQFENINARAKTFQEQGVPVISVDTKKKELVGAFKNDGREWHPKGQPPKALVHDFPDRAVGKAIPYGVYDVADNSAWVSVGNDHDTPKFAVSAVEAWWEHMGLERYPSARELFITADAGGSNGYRSRVWKAELQNLADRRQLTIHVSHFPPGTSKWNKIEHRLFSFITLNWRGRPLTSYETVVSLIASTTTRKGLRVEAALDNGAYPIGARVHPRDMKKLALTPDEFQGKWNYTITPRPRDQN